MAETKIDADRTPTERDRERAKQLEKELGWLFLKEPWKITACLERALVKARAEGAREEREALIEIVESTFPPVIAREFAADLRAREKEKKS